MPAHILKNNTADSIEKWRIVWRYFIDHNIPMFATSSSVPRKYKSDYLILSPRTQIVLTVQSVRSVIELINSLHKTIRTAIDPTDIKFEWNYLGLLKEREYYLNYLNQFFWTHQSDFEFHADYQSFVENPWLCLQAASSLGSVIINLGSDGFSQKSLDFVEMISVSVPQAEYNPYWISSDLGSFQWVIEVSGVYSIQGVLISENQQLKLKVDVIALTEIVI